MSRHTLLVRAALAVGGASQWRYARGEGWRDVPFSAERLEAMSDSELEDLIVRSERGRAKSVQYPIEHLPGFDPEVDANPTEIGRCDACFVELHETSEAYLVWDRGREGWLLFCAQHRPDTYRLPWLDG